MYIGSPKNNRYKSVHRSAEKNSNSRIDGSTGIFITKWNTSKLVTCKYIQKYGQIKKKNKEGEGEVGREVLYGKFPLPNVK